MFRASIIAAALVLAGTPAIACADATRPQAVVPHADLDLATRNGRKQLDRRIRSAASAVCPLGVFGFGARIAQARCAQLAVARSETQVRQAVAAAGSVRAPVRLAGTAEKTPS